MHYGETGRENRTIVFCTYCGRQESPVERQVIGVKACVNNCPGRTRTIRYEAGVEEAEAQEAIERELRAEIRR